MLDWYYHTCPNCGGRSRRRILRNELKNTELVDGSRSKWTRGGNMEIKEPFEAYLHLYEVEHECRLCGHRWVERVTKQRPW